MRKAYLDNLSGVFILVMIFVIHLGGMFLPGDKILYLLALVFSPFLSWFFFKSGMLYRRKPLNEVIYESSRRLLLPWAIFTFVPIIIGLIHNVAIGEEVVPYLSGKFQYVCQNAATNMNLAIWFLPCLFFVRVLFEIVHGEIGIHPILVAIVSLAFAFWMNLKGAEILPYWLGTIGLGLAFYSLGNTLKTSQFNKWVLMAAVAVYLLSFVFPSLSNIRFNTFSSWYLVGVLYGIAGIVLFDNLFSRFLDKEVPLLSHIGRNSMVYLIVHWPIMVLSAEFLRCGRFLPTFSPIVQYISATIMMIISLFVADKIFSMKYFSWMVGVFK